MKISNFGRCCFVLLTCIIQTSLSSAVTTNPLKVVNFKQAAYSVNEGATNVLVSVVRTGGAAGVSVGYEVLGVSALDGSDVVLTNGVVTFAANQVSKNISV